jgi:hypothetical protein
MNTPVQMPSEEPPQLASLAIQHAEHHGTASSSSGFTRARHSPNSNNSAVGVNPSNIEMAPHLQAPVQVIRQRVVEVPVEPPVLFQPGFLPNWEDKMNLSNPGQLTIYPALTE